MLEYLKIQTTHVLTMMVTIKGFMAVQGFFGLYVWFYPLAHRALSAITGNCGMQNA